MDNLFERFLWFIVKDTLKVAGGKGISETKSKQQSPCSNCMQRPVMSWGNACSTCMHKPVRCMHQPVTLWADACTYCMGSKVSSLSRIYLYSGYFEIPLVPGLSHRHLLLFFILISRYL
jgi:hypothetical protein